MAATLQALAASAQRVASLDAELRAERERRNHLIVDLVDQGTDRKDISREGMVSPKSICQFLGIYGSGAIYG